MEKQRSHGRKQGGSKKSSGKSQSKRVSHRVRTRCTDKWAHLRFVLRDGSDSAAECARESARHGNHRVTVVLFHGRMSLKLLLPARGKQCVLCVYVCRKLPGSAHADIFTAVHVSLGTLCTTPNRSFVKCAVCTDYIDTSDLRFASYHAIPDLTDAQGVETRFSHSQSSATAFLNSTSLLPILPQMGKSVQLGRIRSLESLFYRYPTSYGSITPSG